MTDPSVEMDGRYYVVICQAHGERHNFGLLRTCPGGKTLNGESHYLSRGAAERMLAHHLADAHAQLEGPDHD